MDDLPDFADTGFGNFDLDSILEQSDFGEQNVSIFPQDFQNDVQQEKWIQASVHTITVHGNLYFGMNREGISRKLVTCHWGRDGNVIRFPEQENRDSLELFIDDTEFGQSFLIKSFYKPLPSSNENLVEAIIYMKIISHLVESFMTPHVPTPYALVSCSKFIENIRLTLKDYTMIDPLSGEKIPVDMERFDKHIREFKNEKAYVLCIEKIDGRVYTLDQFIGKYLQGLPLEQKLLTEYDMKSVLFQIFYTLDVFNRSGILHNNLHPNNILIQIQDDVLHHVYTVDENNFHLFINYKVYIVDFKKSLVFDSPFLRWDSSDFFQNPFEQGTIINSNHKYGSDENPIHDTLTLLQELYKIPNMEGNLIRTVIESWISKDWMLTVTDILFSEYFELFTKPSSITHNTLSFQFDIQKVNVLANVVPPSENEDDSFLGLLQMNEDLIKYHTSMFTKQGSEYFNMGFKENIPIKPSYAICSIVKDDYKLVRIPQNDGELIFVVEGKAILEETTTSIINDEPFLLQFFYTPSPFDNGPLVEAVIYTNLISPLIEHNMTPHLLEPYSHYICNHVFENIQHATQSNEFLSARNRILNNLKDEMGALARDEVNMLSLTNIDGVPLFLFLQITHIDEREFQTILFQIFYTLYVFNRCGLRHNDLTLENILVVEHQSPEHVRYKVKDKSFMLSIRYKIYIVHFDKASVTGSDLLKKRYAKTPLATGNIRNTTIENNKYSHGQNGGMMNGLNTTIDSLKFLKSLYTWVGTTNYLGCDFSMWVSSSQILELDQMYYHAVFDSNMEGSSSWVASTKDILFSPYFEDLAQRGNQKNATAVFEYNLSKVKQDDQLSTVNSYFETHKIAVDKLIKHNVPEITEFGKELFEDEFPNISYPIDELNFPKPGVSVSMLMDFEKDGVDCILKFYLRPSPFNNGSLVESIVYTKIISKLLLLQMTPHLPKPYFHTIDKNFPFKEIQKRQAADRQVTMREKFESMKNSAMDGFQNHAHSRQNYPKQTSEYHLLCIEKVPGVTSFNDFLRDYKDNEKAIQSVLFQILYTLYIFNQIGMRHNDLHGENVLVQTLKTPIYHKYIVDDGNVPIEFYLKIKHKAYVIDFDRATVNDSEFLKSMYTNPENPLSQGYLTNTVLDYKYICYMLGTCNVKNEKSDTFKLLFRLFQHDLNGVNIGDWISPDYLQYYDPTTTDPLV